METSRRDLSREPQFSFVYEVYVYCTRAPVSWKVIAEGGGRCVILHVKRLGGTSSTHGRRPAQPGPCGAKSILRSR